MLAVGMAIFRAEGARAFFKGVGKFRQTCSKCEVSVCACVLCSPKQKRLKIPLCVYVFFLRVLQWFALFR